MAQLCRVLRGKSRSGVMPAMDPNTALNRRVHVVPWTSSRKLLESTVRGKQERGFLPDLWLCPLWRPEPVLTLVKNNHAHGAVVK